MKLIKADLIDSIYRQACLSKKQSAQVVESLIDVIKDSLENGGDILISGLGKFCVRDKSRRRGRNPWTGKELTLDERRVVRFKCSGVLRGKINKGR
jgi:integration host factor subunit alpha